MPRIKKYNTKYSPEFKLSVILDMREHHLGYHETVRKYCLGNNSTGGARAMLHRWERIYLEEGAVGLTIERRGCGTNMDNPKKGRPKKKPLDKEIKNDLIAENQRLKKPLKIKEFRLEFSN